MPCNQKTCPDYTPAGDGTGATCSNPCGVTVTKKIWPVWDTARINVPDWYRDRIMYHYDDVCESSARHTINGTANDAPPGGGTATNSVEFGLGGVENPNKGRVRKVLPNSLNYWWKDNTVICPPFFGYARTPSIPSKVRYWDHYPSEQSFEAIRSDTWFSYIYDTSNGVVGKPCYVYCFYMYTLRSGTTGASSYQTYYGIKKETYNCNCGPKQSYVDYTLEDGKITPESEKDPFPLIWTVGTKQQRIAFSYPGAQINTSSSLVGGIYFRSTVKWTGNAGYFIAGTNYSNWQGEWVKVIDYQTGKTGTEIFNFRGSSSGSGNLFDGTTQTPGFLNQRYTCDMLVVAKWPPGFLYQEPQTAPLAYINATWRPSDRDLPGVGGSGIGAIHSKLVIHSIRLANSSVPLQPNVEYDVWVPVEPGAKKRGSYRYLLCGHVKFEAQGSVTIPTTSVKKSVPVTFHMSEPTSVSGTVGADLNTMGFYEVWNSGSTSSYMSSQGNFWKSQKAKIIQDFSIPNGTIIRCEISSYYDDDEEEYYTRWKVISIIRYGSDYNDGDGTTYSNQNVYYLYYPSISDPNRIGVALMISGTQDGDWSEGNNKIQIGETINGWTVQDVKHSDEDFNMHVAYITGGTNDFAKDTNYTSSSGLTVNVKAGWGIKDRAAIVGRYEFQRKEILYVTANANLDVPQEDLDVIKPHLQAVVQNGKVTEIQILKKGWNLKDPLIEPIRISIEPPPTYINQSLYLQLIADGEDPEVATKKARGTGQIAYAEPVFTGDILTRIKIINGGSGYSTTNPPKVAVPYIARKFVTVDSSKTSADEAEPGTMQLFEKSEAFQKIAKTPYSYKQYEWDEDNPLSVQTPVTNVDGTFSGKNKFDITKTKSKQISKRGYDKKDYIAQQEPTYSEKRTEWLKGSVKEMEKVKNSQVFVRPKSGLSKESAQAFLPPGNPNHVKTKNNDYKSLLKSIDQQTKSNTKYWKTFADNQKELIRSGSIDPLISNKINDGLSIDQKDQLSSLSPVVSKTAAANSEPITDQTTLEYVDIIKSIRPSRSNLDDGQYYTKAFRNFYRDYGLVSGDTDKKFNSTLNSIDKKFEDDINEMWKMDLESNRTVVYDGSSVKKAKYGFFNLPCATKDKKYLIQSYCPDPRKNTFIKITVGVKVSDKDYANERGPCTKCLYQDSAVLAAYNDLVAEHGADEVDIADAFCQVYSFPAPYNGQFDGVQRGIPYGNYSLPYSSLLFGGYARSFIKSQFSNQYVYEGCKDYEFSGNLEVLHDRTLETQTFAQAVNRYGNPYDSLCSRRYEDSQSSDEANINNLISSYNDFMVGATAQLSNPTSFSE